MERSNSDLVVEHDGLVLVSKLELIVPCCLDHVRRTRETEGTLTLR